MFILNHFSMQSAAGREARAESSGLKEDLSGLLSELENATKQLDEERQNGITFTEMFSLLCLCYGYSIPANYKWKYINP